MNTLKELGSAMLMTVLIMWAAFSLIAVPYTVYLVEQHNAGKVTVCITKDIQVHNNHVVCTTER